MFNNILSNTAEVPSIDEVIGFVTEFNENVRIFGEISARIKSLEQISKQVDSNTNAIQNLRSNLQALANIQNRQNNHVDDPRNTRGYSSDEPIPTPPDSY